MPDPPGDRPPEGRGVEVRLACGADVERTALEGGEPLAGDRLPAVDDASEFGLLVAAPDQRGIGIGRALLDFAEARSRDRGLRAMQLELLVPRGWRHPSKEFLKALFASNEFMFVE